MSEQQKALTKWWREGRDNGRGRWPGWAASASSGILALALTAIPAAAPSPVADEDLVKATVVFKLAKFVYWPDRVFAAPATPLTFCVLGQTPVTEALRENEGRWLQGRPVQVKVIEGDAVKDYMSCQSCQSCHLLFVNASDQACFERIQLQLTSRPILTVGDAEGFARKDGMIGLMRIERRLRFEIDLAKVHQADLAISAPLLQLADIVTATTATD